MACCGSAKVRGSESTSTKTNWPTTARTANHAFEKRSNTMTELTVAQATAANSGASATARFQQKTRVDALTTPERVDTLVSELITAAHDIVVRHHLTYPEYDALKAWLVQVGADGEWPLFLDVFLEHVVEQVANADRQGSKGTIEGPYYVPSAPALPAQTALPMRENEPGTPVRFTGRVRTV